MGPLGPTRTVGLKALLTHHFPEKTIKAVGYNEPTLTWMAEMDTVQDSDYQGALAIICDTANRPRIDDKRYEQADFTIKIDHHPNDDIYGDLSWVDTSSSSASEMIALFAQENQLALSSEAARLLYAGIVGDTGRFLYPSTSARTFRIASQLREIDFDFTIINGHIDKTADANIGTLFVQLIGTKENTDKAISRLNELGIYRVSKNGRMGVEDQNVT